MVKPWYKEPNVWMLLAPLLLIFVVCSVLVGVAVSGADDRISDDYYKEGKMINNRFAAEHYAREFGVNADIAIDTKSDTISVELFGDAPKLPLLNLYFSHPAQSDMDHRVVLKRISAQGYSGELTQAIDGRWYVKLEPEIKNSDAKLWRLAGENDFNLSPKLHLE